MRTLWTAGAALAALIIAGCTPVPQVVTLDPQPEVVERDVAAPQQVALRVVDRRPQQILGYRDEETGVPLTSERPLDEVLADAMTHALERHGFEVVAWTPRAERRLEVEISTFDYQAERQWIGRQVSIAVGLRSTGHAGERRYSSESTARTSERVIIGPTRAKNTAMVNDVLSRAVQRLVADETMVQTLDGGS